MVSLNRRQVAWRSLLLVSLDYEASTPGHYTPAGAFDRLVSGVLTFSVKFPI